MRNILLRYIACALMCMVMTCLYGQENFDEQLVAITQMTKEQAIYQLEQYQLQHPQFAGVYYHLGKHSEELLATIHPILNYDYLSRVLYNARVYYGNCIHYAQNSSLKDEDFVGIPTQGKKIAYEDIVRYGRKKLEHVKAVKGRVDALYDSYYRMVERYGACRHMFSDFCESYPGEKQAHLRLQAADVEVLNRLVAEFDSLQLDIVAFEQALSAYPIEAYHPRFVYHDIRLYRLDGLTHSNFMDDTIPLWNYGGFAKQFLEKQYADYATYYQAIKQEYDQIGAAVSQWSKGGKTLIKTNKILTNYIQKMDYGSFMVNLTQIQQLCADMIDCHAQGVVADNVEQLLEEDVALALDVLYAHYQTKQAARDWLTVLESQLSDSELSKYKHVLGADTTMQAIMGLAEGRLQMADNVYGEIVKEFYDAIAETITPFEQYKDALTDVVIVADQLPKGNAEVVRVLPIREGYLVVYADGMCYVVDAQLEPIRQLDHKLYAPIRTAYKISGDGIALVSPTHVVFINNEGKVY